MDQNSHILILDDEFLALLDLQTELQQQGYANVSTASTADGAIALVETGDVDAAFIDVNLGSETSYEVAAILRRRNIPFAFITGYAKDAILDEFRDIPSVVKPISRAEIARFLKQY